jgi:hypothetical protein
MFASKMLPSMLSSLLAREFPSIEGLAFISL